MIIYLIDSNLKSNATRSANQFPVLAAVPAVGIDMEGSIAIAKALRHNRTLQELVLGNTEENQNANYRKHALHLPTNKILSGYTQIT